MNGLPPANWYADPTNDQQWRYWDGEQWSDHVAPRAPMPPPDPATAARTVVEQVEVVERVVVTSEETVGQAALSGFKQGFFGRREKRVTVAVREPSIAAMLAGLSREAPRHPLDEQVEVAGETYHIKGIKKIFANLGRPIGKSGSTLEDMEATLVPEPWNPHDGNAVAVVVGDQHVGYLPAELAADYAVPLGRLVARGVLATGTGRIWALSDGGVVRARVTVLIPEASRF
jgi:hypothetical protein